MNWILDLDIRSFFDKLQHDWLVQIVEHRIGDKRVVRLIQKWLKAGVVEDGRWLETEEGSPQGSVPNGQLHSPSEDDQQTHGGKAEGYSSQAAHADARADIGDGAVATAGGAGVLPISRDSRQLGADGSLSQGSAANLVSDAPATKPA